MRMGEQCPYITPCGWCSRKNVPCDAKKPLKEIKQFTRLYSPEELKKIMKRDNQILGGV